MDHQRPRTAKRPGGSCALRAATILLLPLVASLALAGVGVPAAAAAPFQVQGIFQFGPAHVAVAFTDSVDATLAIQSGNYEATKNLFEEENERGADLHD